ncbi:MAG: hypothetical protein WKG01_01085 [Kofleriaceae bacterium]
MKRLILIVASAAACSSTATTTAHVDLRAAVERAPFSLGEYVERAQDSVQRSAGINARIHRDVDQFAVGAIASEQRHELRLDFAGYVVSAQAGGAASAGCQTQISLPEALAIAEAEAGGDSVAVVPDDDDPCMREIQVLVDVTLWEVKVGPGGAIVEKELSDEEL